MKSYHFDLGNSSTGPVGFCACVQAETEAEALEILKDALPDGYGIEDHNPDKDESGIEYLRVYFNPEAVSVADIDDEHDVNQMEED